MTENRKFWFILEPYVFLWSDNSEVLFYNSLAGEGLVFPNKRNIRDLINKLEDKSNLYCIEIDSKILSIPEVKNLIYKLRKENCGDLVDQKIMKEKPFVFIPELNINEDVNRAVNITENKLTFGYEVVRNLHEISIYLTGRCESRCSGCGETQKQMPWCYKTGQELSFQQIKKLLKKIPSNFIHRVNLFGGDLFNYSNLRDVFTFMDNYNFNEYYHSHYSLLRNINGAVTALRKTNRMLIVLVDNSFEESLLVGAIQIVKSNNIKSKFLFKVESEKEFNDVKEFETKYELDIQILPFYNKKNKNFFENNIYLTKEDLRTPGLNKREIFANQVLNTNDFGKLTISSDGKIYANLNFKPLGEIEDNLNDLVYKELKQKSSWRRTRDNLNVCRNCNYRYLCPSPSNYELAIGKFNLCHIKLKTTCHQPE